MLRTEFWAQDISHVQNVDFRYKLQLFTMTSDLTWQPRSGFWIQNLKPDRNQNANQIWKSKSKPSLDHGIKSSFMSDWEVLTPVYRRVGYCIIIIVLKEAGLQCRRRRRKQKRWKCRWTKKPKLSWMRAPDYNLCATMEGYTPLFSVYSLYIKSHYQIRSLTFLFQYDSSESHWV